MTVPFVGTALNLGYRGLQRVFMGRLDVRVRSHEATLQQPYVADAVFINVTNLSPRRSVRPTHVTVMTEPPVPVVTRPLRTIQADGDTWETWIEKSRLPNPNQDVRALVQVRLSDGKTLSSVPVVPGVDLPTAGEVPG